MLECLILGDSIGHGVAQIRRECQEIASVGINSNSFNRKYLHDDRLDPTYEVAVVSLGTNDWEGINTEDNLEKLRSRIHAKHVIWMMPQPRFKKVQDAVVAVAKRFGDSLIEVPKQILEKDRIHPTAAGYKLLAEQTTK